MKKDDLILAIALVLISIGVYSSFHPEKFDFAKLNIPFLSQIKPAETPKKELNWGPYMREIETKIKANWRPPKNDTSTRIVVSFKIGKNGDLLSQNLITPSKNEKANQKALDAIIASAPFRPLPKDFKGDSVTIEFTFDYNIIKK